MSDMNPYESPKALPAKCKARSIKRGIGLVAVLLLTPLAVLIASGISCVGATLYVGGPETTEEETARIFFIANVIFLLPPLITLIGMAVWACRTYVASRQVLQADEAAQ